LNNKGLVSISLVSAFRWKKSSDRDEWVAEGYSGRDSKASEDEVGEIAEDQVTNDGQGEEDVHDGAKSSDDQEFWGTGRSRSARMWSPKPAQGREPRLPTMLYDEVTPGSAMIPKDPAGKALQHRGIFDIIRSNLQRASQEQARHYNLRRREWDRSSVTKCGYANIHSRRRPKVSPPNWPPNMTVPTP